MRVKGFNIFFKGGFFLRVGDKVVSSGHRFYTLKAGGGIA
jgi:hypothetical protein